MKTLKLLLVFTIVLMYYNAVAQIPTCSPTGNILIFSNYDGGELNINIDQNIPNLKIGVCTYEPVRITISGPFASNVVQVLYAGFNSVQNNNNCNIGNFPTSITGVPLSNQSILTAPPITLNNPNGYNFGIICGYSCDVNSNQGGCNTIDQIEDYFITQLGGTLYSLNAQYCCWLGSDQYQVSQLAGSCCNTSSSTTTLTSAIGTDNQSVCINNAIASITYSYNNFAPTISGLPNGVNSTINNGIVTINGTPTIAGTFNYNLSIPGNCGGVQTTTGTIIVNDLSGATIVASACNSYTAPWGNVYTQSGTYTDTLSALNGCDSIVSLNLTITGAIITPPITTSACSTYTAPWGTIYTQSGTYTDTLTSVNGCDSIVSVNLTITGLPTVTASSLAASCGLPDGTATASATGGAGNYSYSWSNGVTGNSVTGLSSGTYVVTATDQNGCFSSIQVTVLSNPPAALSITANDSCLENNIPFSILTGATISSVTWNFGDTASGANNTSASLQPTHLFSSTGSYNVTANILATCGSFEINYPLQIVRCDSVINDCALYVPNAFTPNDDGINDKFYPITSCALQQYELLIFDRWGEIIFKTSNQLDKWDGKAKSDECPDGVYVYLISYKLPSQPIKSVYGTIALLR